MKAHFVAPDCVNVTGHANRLKTPAPGARQWRTARVVVIALVVPVLLFFPFSFS
jgi:hypothetical protein